jgi:hypothetical protein
MRRKRLTLLAAACAATLALAVAATGLVAARRSGPTSAHSPRAFVHQKGDPHRVAAGGSAEAAVGPNEVRHPDNSPDVEAYLQRAYPADEVALADTIAAQNAWAHLKSAGGSPGTWQLIGPSSGTVPAVLNVLGDSAQYVTSGRVTAMAISPKCGDDECRLYIAAAGGGVWRTKDALDDNPDWKFVSGSFGTNAMGSLVIDPTDASGRTLYAGTGEPNVSVDSEAGVGIYKSTDGGESWTLLPGSAQFQGRAISSVVITPDGSILAGVARAVRGVSSVIGGTTSNPPGGVAFGVYKSTDGGATFTNTTPVVAGLFPFGSLRGINQVDVDPNNGSIYYASALGAGIWRSSNAGATWTQMKNPLNTPNGTNNTDRSEFSVVNAGGTTRIYVGIGAASPSPPAQFYRANNAQTATDGSFVNMTTAQNVNYCHTQCWYDNIVYSPAGNPDVVYLLGSFDYNQDHLQSNARAVLLSTDGGATWSDLTQDSDPSQAEFTHPDQHAIVVNPHNPFQYFEGSDGGVIRSDGRFSDVSYKCDTRGLTAADTAYCKSLLNRVPHEITTMNRGLSTLQFMSLSASLKQSGDDHGDSRGNHSLQGARTQDDGGGSIHAKIQGGTQDNGTFNFTGSTDVWPQEIYGDGGQSGFSSANSKLRFNTFTSQFNDVNFRDGDPTGWCVATGAIASSPEGSYFYTPIIADPNPANGGTIFQGSFSVWRTQDWGGSQAFLEANCPEFTTSATDPACGDFVRIGPPGATDLTDTLAAPVYGPDRRGGAVSAIARSAAASNLGTLWVATGAGRVFISDNANAAASSVVWTRIDPTSSNDPARFPSSIYVDPANPHHAWISYSGYNGTTPAQPGHVFDVTWNGTVATWTSLDGTSFPNLPATSVVRDDPTGDLYVSTDFGVMRLANASTTWTVAGSGLPMVEVPGLTILPSARLLLAATHGRSAWALSLSQSDSHGGSHH